MFAGQGAPFVELALTRPNLGLKISESVSVSAKGGKLRKKRRGFSHCAIVQCQVGGTEQGVELTATLHRLDDQRELSSLRVTRQDQRGFAGKHQRFIKLAGARQEHGVLGASLG